LKRVIIAAGQKGGLGKSTTARVFVDLARRAGRTVSAWDLDEGVGSLALVYAEREPEVGCATDDVRDDMTKARWLDAFSGSADDIVLDVPGGAMSALLGIVVGGAETLVGEAKKNGREVVVVSVIGTQRDSTAIPLAAIEAFAGSDVRHVVVKNLYFGKVEDFVIFDGFADPLTGERRYGTAAENVKEAGAEVVLLPKLPPATMALMDVHHLSFVQGAEAADLIHRRHSLSVAGWLRETEEAFAGSWLRASDTGEVVAKKGRRGGGQLAAV
jgi:hypothetical protein